MPSVVFCKQKRIEFFSIFYTNDFHDTSKTTFNFYIHKAESQKRLLKSWDGLVSYLESLHLTICGIHWNLVKVKETLKLITFNFNISNTSLVKKKEFCCFLFVCCCCFQSRIHKHHWLWSKELFESETVWSQWQFKGRNHKGSSARVVECLPWLYCFYIEV